MNTRCDRCCQPLNECKCILVKGPYRCFRCTGGFKVGDQYRSDAPGIVYHLGCYLAEVKKPS